MHILPRSRSGVLLVGVVAGLVATGCTPPSSSGGEVVIETDERIPEIRAARAALAEPVPAVMAEAERLVAALEDVWTTPAAVEERAARAAALRSAPFGDAVDALDAVELEGRGPDVAAAREVRDAMVADARGLVAAVSDEVTLLTSLPAFDGRLDDLVSRWDQRGSYSQQLAAFEELAIDAAELATEADGETAEPGCLELWERRSEAAATVAERTEELRVLVRDRRGQEFDDLRDEYRQDPFGFGERLGALDAAAASDCWADASPAAAVVDLLGERVDELAEALDPEDLQA